MGGLFSKKQIKLIIVGLDNSGKTTMINYYNPKKQQNEDGTAPTVGYQVETFTKDDIEFTILDMSGQGKYRDMWQKYCEDVDGIIFVLDSSDQLRFAIAYTELESLFEESNLQKRPIPILFFANKKDSKDSAKEAQIIEGLQLNNIKDRPWRLFYSNALKGEGINEGFQWLNSEIIKAKK